VEIFCSKEVDKIDMIMLSVTYTLALFSLTIIL